MLFEGLLPHACLSMIYHNIRLTSGNNISTTKEIHLFNKNAGSKAIPYKNSKVFKEILQTSFFLFHWNMSCLQGKIQGSTTSSFWVGNQIPWRPNLWKSATKFSWITKKISRISCRTFQVKEWYFLSPTSKDTILACAQTSKETIFWEGINTQQLLSDFPVSIFFLVRHPVCFSIDSCGLLPNPRISQKYITAHKCCYCQP